MFHGFGKLKPVPMPEQIRDTLSRVYPYPCHALSVLTCITQDTGDYRKSVGDITNDAGEYRKGIGDITQDTGDYRKGMGDITQDAGDYRKRSPRTQVTTERVWVTPPSMQVTAQLCNSVTHATLCDFCDSLRSSA